MAVRSKLLAGPILLTTVGPTTLYTVPAGETALVKTISEVNGNGTARWWSLTVNVGSGDVPVVWRRSVPAAGSQQLQTWWALPAGAVIKVTQELASAITLAIFGTELEGQAD